MRGKLLAIIPPDALGSLALSFVQLAQDARTLEEQRTLQVLSQIYANLIKVEDAFLAERSSFFYHMQNIANPPRGVLDGPAALTQSDEALNALHASFPELEPVHASSPCRRGISQPETAMAHMNAGKGVRIR